MRRTRAIGGVPAGARKKQPFCDGSHKGTGFTPVEWKAEKAEQPLLVLRLQAHGASADVRRQPQETDASEARSRCTGFKWLTLLSRRRPPINVEALCQRGGVTVLRHWPSKSDIPLDQDLVAAGRPATASDIHEIGRFSRSRGTSRKYEHRCAGNRMRPMRRKPRQRACISASRKAMVQQGLCGSRTAVASSWRGRNAPAHGSSVFRLDKGDGACCLLAPRDARPSARAVLRGNPRAHAGARGRGLRKLVTDRLVNAGLAYEGAKAFVTPRRLALAVQGVPVRQPDVKEEKKGPRVGAPEGAIRGFLRAAGLESIDEAKVEPDKKGDFYVAVVEKPGRPAIEVIGEIVPEVVKTFPWPKSMRWGEQSRSPARSAGCGRCIPSSRPSGRRPRSPTSSRLRSTASRRATTPAATASWRPSRSRCAGSTTMWRSSTRPRSCSTRSGARR